jgi:hypothetical protein
MDHHDPAERLTRRDGPRLHLLVTSPSEAFDQAQRLNSREGTVARVVRGAKCRTTPALFDEFAAAWQFPPYFGANWDALDECLSDLDWLPARSRVLVVTNALHLLDGEPAGAFRLFVELLGRLVPDESAAATFHTVFQVEPAEESAFAARLTAAGASFDVL